MAGAAVVALVLAGVGYWSYGSAGRNQTIAAGDDPASLSTARLDLGPFEGSWSSDSWPVLTMVPDGYVVEDAVLQHGFRSVFYRNSGTGSVIQLITVSPNRPAGPFSELVEVMGAQGFMDELAAGDDDGGLLLHWSAHGVNFMVSSTTGLTAEALVALAESIRPVTREFLETGVSVLYVGMPTSAPSIVAQAMVDGEAASLYAATDDGVVFELGSGSDSGGPYYLETGLHLSISTETSDPDAPIVMSGLVDHEVTELVLRSSGGDSRSIEIQSRDLGYEVAFFIVELADEEETLEAIGENGEVLESFSLVDFAPRLGPVDMAEMLLTPEEFTREVMGWEDVTFSDLPESQGGGVEATQAGAGATVRFVLSSDGQRLEWVTPGADWSLDLSSKADTVALQLGGLPRYGGWTVLISTEAGIRQTIEVPAEELIEDWVYLDVPGLDSGESFSGVILARDAEGLVLSALNFGSWG